jgi:peptidoglycan/LPS O-acetylase OafA/YrhL
VADGTDAPASSSRYDALDGLRAVAVVCVMAYHLVWAVPEIAGTRWQIQGGWVGVDVFFVLSGFLIGSLLLSELDRTGGISLPRFFGRRLLRLYPAMVAFAGALTWFTVAVDHVPLRQMRSTLQATALYYLNVPLGHDRYVVTTFAHLWTLSVEFHFYLMLPVLFLGLHATRAPRWSWAVVLAVIAGAVAVHRSMAWDPRASFLGPYVSTFTRLDALVVGVLLALARHQGWLRVDRGVAARLGLAVLGAAWIAFVVWTTPSDSGWLYRWGMVVDALAAAAIVWFLVASPAARGARALASPLPRWLGQRSYALYLCHYAVFRAFQDHLADHLGPWPRALLAPAAAVAIAELSYRLVEAPALGLKERLRAPTAGAAAV